MASIPGIAYILIGVLTIGISYFINQRTQSNSLTLFMFIGGIFIIIGLIKIALREKKPKTRNQPTHQHGQTARHPQNPPNRQPSPQPPAHKPPLHPHPVRQHLHTSERTAAENQPSEFIPINPQNKVEQYILDQEVREAGKEAVRHPPITTCPRCKRRQYRIREHCFVCNHRI